MKNRIWITLPLAAALMAPAYAQSDNTNSASQNSPAATQNATQAVQENQAPPANQNTGGQNQGELPPLQAERHEGFWGKLNPLARKKYVQRQMEPIRNRVNELDELTAANGKAIKDADARAQEGIRMASARANEADQHALEAGNHAQTADQTAQQASTRLQTVQQVVSNIDQYQPATETEIRLRPGQTVLSKKAKEALDEMADSVKGQNAYLFEVQGFSSGKGAAAIENSQHMAQSVVRYLVVQHDIPVYRIYLLGMGNAPAPSTAGGTSRRLSRGGRVDISLLKNPNLEQLSSVSPLPTPGAEPSATTPSQGGVSGATTAPPAQSSAPGSPSGTQPPASNMNAPATSQPAPQR